MKVELVGVPACDRCGANETPLRIDGVPVCLGCLTTTEAAAAAVVMDREWRVALWEYAPAYVGSLTFLAERAARTAVPFYDGLGLRAACAREDGR